jgi:hypothetical protein
MVVCIIFPIFVAPLNYNHMRKLFIFSNILLFSVIFTGLYAQNEAATESVEKSKTLDTTNFLRHEVKINAIFLLLAEVIDGVLFDVHYEYLLSSKGGVGGSLFINFANGYDYQIVGFFRSYFGKQPASGFFIEGNIAGNYNAYYTDNKSFKMGMGIAVGYKFVVNDNMVVDLFGGAGRSFTRAPEVYPRASITIGYRF